MNDRLELEKVARDRDIYTNVLWACVAEMFLLLFFVAVMVVKTGNQNWCWLLTVLALNSPSNITRLAKRAFDNKPLLGRDP